MSRYQRRDYNVICDLSGFKCKASQTVMVRVREGDLVKTLRVRKDFADKVNPQDIIRVPRDDQTVPNPRPDTPPVFTEQNPWNALLTGAGELLTTDTGDTLTI